MSDQEKSKEYWQHIWASHLNLAGHFGQCVLSVFAFVSSVAIGILALKVPIKHPLLLKLSVGFATASVMTHLTSTRISVSILSDMSNGTLSKAQGWLAPLIDLLSWVTLTTLVAGIVLLSVFLCRSI
jgi:hypothetical protein